MERKSINSNYVVVKKLEEEETEGFKTVQVQDSSIYRGEVIAIPDCPVYVDNHVVSVGDKIIFKKISPDTHEIHDPKLFGGQKVKFVIGNDILMVI